MCLYTCFKSFPEFAIYDIFAILMYFEYKSSKQLNGGLLETED